MKLLAPDNVPDAARTVLMDALAERALTSGFGTPSLARARPKGLSIAGWHRLFMIESDPLAPDMTLARAAVAFGWRCMVLAEGEVVAAAEAYHRNGAWVMGLVSEGVDVTATEAALDLAEHDPSTLEYAPVLVRAMASGISALWLQAVQDRREDRVIIFPSPEQTASGGTPWAARPLHLQRPDALLTLLCPKGRRR